MNFKIIFQDGNLHPVSRQILKEQIDVMRGKGKAWTITATQRNYTPTRYKYLFDCVYKDALQVAAKKYKIWNPKKQDFEFIETAAQLHTCMLYEFNSVQVVNTSTGELFRVAESSTKLEDANFYQVFEEKVIQQLTEMGCYDDDGCMSRDKWAEKKHPKKDLQNQ